MGEAQNGSGWKTMRIDSVKSRSDNAIAIGPFGSRMKADRYVPTGVPVIRGSNITDTRALLGEFVYVADQTADEFRICNVFPGDLVFPHRGSIGLVGIVPSDKPRYLLSTSLMKLSCDTNLVDPLFLFYFFRSGAGRHELLKNASTVGTPGIGTPLASLRAIEVPVPPRPVQEAVARILGTLDDKIELNRQTSETLEQMARALFKSWFIDFDPVRAKAERRAPFGMDADTADLFPGQFAESELGPIPRSWRAGSVGDCVSLRRGTTYSGSLVGKPGPALLGLGSIRPGGGFRNDGYKTYGGECPPDLMLGPGELYVSLKGATKDGDMIGSAARVPITVASGRLTQDTVKLEFSDAAMTRYMYRLLLTPEYRSYCANRAMGSAVVALSRDDFLSYPLVFPSAPVVDRFNSALAALESHAEHCAAENVYVAGARDALLPRLLSGELRIQDAERFIADVT